MLLSFFNYLPRPLFLRLRMGKRSALLRVKLYPDLDSVQASAQPTRYKKQHHTSPHSYSHCHSVTFLSLMLPGNLPLQSLASAATRTSCRICDQRNQRTLTEDSLKHSLCHCHYICIYRVSPKKRNFDFGGQYLRFKSTYWGK